MDERPQSDPPDISLRSVPLSLWGFQRLATAQLVERLRSSQERLLAERAELQEKVLQLGRASSEWNESERKLASALEQMQSERDWLRKRVQAVEEELKSTQRELGRLEGREAMATEMLEAAKRLSFEMRAEARTEADETLRKAREREAATLHQAQRELKSAQAERERLRAVIGDLSGGLSVALEQLEAGVQPGASRSGTSGSPATQGRAPRPSTGDAEPSAAARPRLIVAGSETRASSQAASMPQVSLDVASAAAAPAVAAAAPEREFGVTEAATAAAADAHTAAAPRPRPDLEVDIPQAEAKKRQNFAVSILAYTTHRIALVVLQGILLIAAIAAILAVTDAIHF